MEEYDYVIVGSGLAGVSAVKGVRREDESGTVLMIGAEEALPYNRPPLSKDLLLGDKTLDEIRIEKKDFYREQGVKLELGTRVVDVYPEKKVVGTESGTSYGYGKLLLATGGRPRKLKIPGGEEDGIYYYRDLEDYKRLKEDLDSSDRAIVVGGGFIGSEMAAGLHLNGLRVSIVFPEEYLLERIFPGELAGMIQEDYIDRGVNVLNTDTPKSIQKADGLYRVETKGGEELTGDLVVVGIGISPADQLGEEAGLEVFDGIGVDRYLRTTDSSVYAAGDVAYFPYLAREDCTRVEHWDHAIKQGRTAGRNMAGGEKPYDYIPYFFSDLFDFGFEAVGETDSRLETYVDWREEGETGAIYYLSEEGRVRGVLLLGLWGKKEQARELIEGEETFETEDLAGEIG